MSDLAMTTTDIISLADNISGTMVLLLIGYGVVQALRKTAPWLAEREAAQQERMDRIVKEQQARIDEHTKLTMTAHKVAITELLAQSDKHIAALLSEQEKDRELLRDGLDAINSRLAYVEREITIVKERLTPGAGRESER